jgi:hypothetical protein
MALPATVKNKKQGDIIRSDDWNIVTNEVDRLDLAKANLSGSAFTGPLSVQAPVGQPQLSLAGSSGNVTTEPGDLRIGGTFHQLRIGVATSGGTAGDVRIRSVALSQGPAKVSSRLMLGAGSVDMCTFDSDGITTFHDSAGNTALAIAGTDLILPGRTNPTWHVKNANGTRGNGKMCRAFVNWKASATAPDELYINWDNDFAGGTFVASNLHVLSHELSFGATTRQMINLWQKDYGIGVQDSTSYFRSGNNFAWFRGGSHNNATYNPGTNGTMIMQLWANGDFVLPVGRAFKPNGGTWLASSDERLKKSVNNLSGSLERLMQLRGVTFEWINPAKAGGIQGLQTGMIAQEVEKVFPEWVTDDPEGYKAIGYTGFEAHIVEALRELKNEIDTIKAHLGLSQPLAVGKPAARSTKKS